MFAFAARAVPLRDVHVASMCVARASPTFWFELFPPRTGLSHPEVQWG